MHPSFAFTPEFFDPQKKKGKKNENAYSKDILLHSFYFLLSMQIFHLIKMKILRKDSFYNFYYGLSH